jgi:hypothetical protein
MNRAEMLQQLTQLCRSGIEPTPRTITPSGCDALDAFLPGGGWQSGSIVELMPNHIGIGELRFLMPTLARITQADRHIAFISPPFIPFAPALNQHGVQLDRLFLIKANTTKDVLWCIEQTLRCKSFGAVLGWPIQLVDRDIRRLQLAAEAGASIGFLYRSSQAAHEASPAAVRIQLTSDAQNRLDLKVLKCRGARGGVSFTLNSPSARAPEPKLDLSDSVYSLFTIR